MQTQTETARQKPTLNVMVQQSDFMEPSDIETIGKILRELEKSYNIREHGYDPAWGFPKDWQMYGFFIIMGPKGYCKKTPEEAFEMQHNPKPLNPPKRHKEEGIYLC